MKHKCKDNCYGLQETHNKESKKKNPNPRPESLPALLQD